MLIHFMIEKERFSCDPVVVRHELQVLVKHESLRLWHLDTISLVTDADAFMKDHSDYMRSVSIVIRDICI